MFVTCDPQCSPGKASDHPCPLPSCKDEPGQEDPENNWVEEEAANEFKRRVTSEPGLKRTCPGAPVPPLAVPLPSSLTSTPFPPLVQAKRWESNSILLLHPHPVLPPILPACPSDPLTSLHPAAQIQSLALCKYAMLIASLPPGC